MFPTWNEMVVAGDVLAVEEGLAEVQSRLGPLHVEVKREGDGVVLVVDLEHVGDLDACEDNLRISTTITNYLIKYDWLKITTGRADDIKQLYVQTDRQTDRQLTNVILGSLRKKLKIDVNEGPEEGLVWSEGYIKW